jgi:hypothetical protein
MKGEVPTLSHFLFLVQILINGTMKEIKLSQFGKTRDKYVALVDDEDFEYLNQWKWHVILDDRNCYAARTKNKILLHRVIMKTPKGMEVDHIDHNGLNNQKYNLRNCTKRENVINSRKLHGKSKYIGVSPHRKSFMARITTNGHLINIGSFDDEKNAAKAYDLKAKELFGEFANLNFPDR